MARICEKNFRRFRIQFTMRRDLYERYETAVTRAAALRLLIDFNQDFEAWFDQQLQQVDAICAAGKQVAGSTPPNNMQKVPL